MRKLLISVFTFSSILSPISPLRNPRFESTKPKEAKRAICIEYYDFIAQSTYSVCGVHAYDYLNDVNTIKHLPKTSISQEIVNSSSFINTPIFSINNNYFDVSYPANYSASLVGVYTPVKYFEYFVQRTDVTMYEYDSLVFGDTYPTFYSSSLENRVREKIKDIRITIPEADIKLGDFYTSRQSTFSHVQKFYCNPINGYSAPPWKIEAFSYYMPIQIRQHKLCSELESLCKGQKGSYVSDVFYHFIPVNYISFVKCYNYQGIRIAQNFPGHYDPLFLSSISSASGHPHIRLNNIHEI